jgi:hypothetical protein
MLTFRSPEDFRAAAGTHAGNGNRALLEVAERRFREMLSAFADLGCDHDPDRDGFFALLEPGEESRPLSALGLPGLRLTDLTLEAVLLHAEAGLFECVLVASNSFALSLFVPCVPGLDPGVRRWLEGQAQPAPGPPPLPQPAREGGEGDG